MKVIVIVMMLSLSGCSTLTGIATSALTGAGNDPLLEVSTEVTAGDKNQAIEVGANEKDITGETVNIDEGVAFWQAALSSVVFFFTGLFSPQLVVRRK